MNSIPLADDDPQGELLILLEIQLYIWKRVYFLKKLQI
jgi:hypothetical protein